MVRRKRLRSRKRLKRMKRRRKLRMMVKTTLMILMNNLNKFYKKNLKMTTPNLNYNSTKPNLYQKIPPLHLNPTYLAQL